MKIFVGNLSHDAIDDDVKRAFERFGTVGSVNLKRDKGECRGFGFVYMPNEAEAQAALAGLQGVELLGRALDVSPARIKKDERRVTLQKRELVKPQHKPSIEPRPWKGAAGETKPWQKRGDAKPWHKPSGDRKQWDTRPKGNKPWQKRVAKDAPSQDAGENIKPWHKPAVGEKPWKKRKNFKPWQKPSVEHRPFKKKGGPRAS